MTRCTCVWRRDLQGRLLPDPECPSGRHSDDPALEPVPGGAEQSSRA